MGVVALYDWHGLTRAHPQTSEKVNSKSIVAVILGGGAGTRATEALCSTVEEASRPVPRHAPLSPNKNAGQACRAKCVAQCAQWLYLC